MMKTRSFFCRWQLARNYSNPTDTQDGLEISPKPAYMLELGRVDFVCSTGFIVTSS